MMSAQKYCFRSLVEEIEVFIQSTRTQALEQEWEYTKRMMAAHNENPRLAWKEFDRTLTGEDISPPLQGLILNLLSFIPEKRLKGFHRAIEVGRARARGMSREEALQRHLEAISCALNPAPNLRVIEGGKKSSE